MLPGNRVRPPRCAAGSRPDRPAGAIHRRPLLIERLEDRLVLSAAHDLVGVTALRNDPLFAGIDGSGLAVAVIDTGVDFSHPLLAAGHVASRDIPSGTDGVSWTDPHGTHVAGIIGARDPDIGIAPAVSLIGLQVFTPADDGRVLAQATHTEAALRWVLDHYQQHNIVAVNMSLGGGFFTSADQVAFIPYADEIAALEAAGVTVVSAAGNSFKGNETLNSGSPGILSTLNVGSVWEDGADGGPFEWLSGATDFTTGPDRLVSHSQRPPLAANTIFAPGALINSTVPNGGFHDTGGTSMASPLVAGAVALVQEAAVQFGGRLLAPAEVSSLLISTAASVFDGDDENDNVANTSRNFPRLDVYAAIREVRRRFEAIAPPPSPGVGGDANGTIGGAFLGPRLDGNPAAPIPAAIGTDGTATQVGPSDVDIYRFEVAIPGSVSIEVGSLASDPSDFDSLLRLFDAAGNELAFDDDGGADLFSRLEVALGQGVYYVGVSGFDNRNYNPQVAGSGVAGAMGNYALTFGVANSDPNGTINGAVPVNLGNDLAPLFFPGLLGADLGVPVTTSDVDLFRIELPDSGRLFVDVDTPFLDGFPDTFLRIFDADGNPALSSDDDLAIDASLDPVEFTDVNFPELVFEDPVDREFFHGHTTDSFIAAEVSGAGVFYIGVSTFSNQDYNPASLAGRAPAGSDGGSYNLIISFVNNDQNGSITQAFDESVVPLPVSNQPGVIGADSNILTGELLEVGPRDVDFIRIRATQAAILEIDVDSFELPPDLDSRGLDPAFVQALRDAPVDAVITLWDALGNLLAINDDNDGLDPFVQYTIEPSTDYFVAVSGFGNETFDPFQLASGGPGDTGLYLFHTRLRNAADAAVLADDQVDHSAVRSLTLNELQGGFIGHDNGFARGNSDVDLYEFTPSVSETYTIRTTVAEEFSADTYLRVFLANGLQLAANDDAADDDVGSLVSLELNAGQTYLIGVSSAPNINYNPLVAAGRIAGDSTGLYQLGIFGANQPPASNADLFLIGSGSVASTASVLANDTDDDGDPLSAILVNPPTRGNLVLTADGTFTYTPGASFQGIDRFTYRASDGSASGNQATVTLLSHEAALVRKLYRQVLNRDPEDSGWQFWTGRIEAGVGLGRVAEGFFESDERLNPIISDYYRQFLLREPDAEGLAYWRDQVWKVDGGPDRVIAGVISSPEFFESAGGTNTLWVTELYRRLLAREPEAEGLDFWKSRLEEHGGTRGDVVFGFVRSDENFRNLVIQWHQAYLGRQPTPAELARLVGSMKNGQSQRDIQIGIFDSAEYIATPTRPGPGAALPSS